MKTIPPILAVSDISAATVDISQEARVRRDSLLVLARNVTVVTSAEECRIATEALKEVKGFTRSIEDARSIVKGPVLDLGKRIDSVAKEVTGALEVEASRLSKAIGAFQAEQARKEEEARLKAWEEERRIREETQRKLDEAQATSRTDAAFERKAEKIETAAFEQIAETRAAVDTIAAPKPAGLSTRTEISFEVTDVAALYRAQPACVNLTPNTTVLKAVLKGLPEGATVPGVRHWREFKSIVR